MKHHQLQNKTLNYASNETENNNNNVHHFYKFGSG